MRMRPPAMALLLAALAALRPAAAHDSWLAPLPSVQGSAFAFATGNRYPLAEVAPPADSVAAAGCVDVRGHSRPLRTGRSTSAGLALHTPATGPLACWAELKAFDIVLEPRLVEVYLHEIRPAPAVRARWEAQQEQGLPWTERYRKFARVEMGTDGASPEVLRALREPRGLPLEIVVAGDAPLRAGVAATFRVVANGEPVAGLSVELVSERSRFGLWGVSDAQGEVRHRLPFPGAWLLRTTWVEPAAQPGQWTSRFATLAFEAK